MENNLSVDNLGKRDSGLPSLISGSKNWTFNISGQIVHSDLVQSENEKIEEYREYFYSVDTVSVDTSIATTVLVLAALAGTIGNMFVLNVFWPLRNKNTSAILIIALAVVDFIACILVVPGQVFINYHLFHFDVFCKLMMYLTYVGVVLDFCLLFAIAVDRYIAICKPTVKTINTRCMKGATVLLTIFSILVCIPPGLTEGGYMWVTTSVHLMYIYTGDCRSGYDEQFINEDGRLAIQIVTFSTFCILSIIIAFMYCSVFNVARQRGKNLTFGFGQISKIKKTGVSTIPLGNFSKYFKSLKRKSPTPVSNSESSETYNPNVKDNDCTKEPEGSKICCRPCKNSTEEDYDNSNPVCCVPGKIVQVEIHSDPNINDQNNFTEGQDANTHDVKNKNVRFDQEDSDRQAREETTKSLLLRVSYSSDPIRSNGETCHAEQPSSLQIVVTTPNGSVYNRVPLGEQKTQTKPAVDVEENTLGRLKTPNSNGRPNSSKALQSQGVQDNPNVRKTYTQTDNEELSSPGVNEHNDVQIITPQIHSSKSGQTPVQVLPVPTRKSLGSASDISSMNSQDLSTTETRSEDRIDSPVSPSQRAKVRARHIKTAKLLLIVTIGLMISWVPFFLTRLELIPRYKTLELSVLIGCAINPIIYSVGHHKFRQQLQSTLRCNRIKRWTL